MLVACEEGGELPRSCAGQGNKKLTDVLLHSIVWPEEVERRTRQECARFGEELPPDLVNPPKLFLGLALYLNAFFDLDFERDLSKFEPIKRSACFDYASDYELNDCQREDLWYYVARMDKTYLKYKFDNRPKPKEPKPEGARTRGRK
jgi:hypothetical protein